MFRSRTTSDTIVIDKIRTSEFLRGVLDVSWVDGRRRRIMVALDEYPGMSLQDSVLAAVARELKYRYGDDAPVVRLADRYRKFGAR